MFERESVQEGEEQKESQADSALSLEPHAGLDLMTVRYDLSQNPELGALTDWLSHIGTSS